MRSSSTLDPVKDNISFLFGKTHTDLHSSIRPVEAGFDILRRLAEVEEALVGKILSYCSTATVYSLRLVSKLWLDLVHGEGDPVDEELGRECSKQGEV